MSDEKKICRNCSAELTGEFCHACGQRDVEMKVPLKDLFHEFADEFLSFDARIFRSIPPFLLRPGQLTLEYVSGKRIRFISPFKLYFFMSFLYFFLSAITTETTTLPAEVNPVNVDSLLNSVRADSVVTMGRKGMKLTVGNDSIRIERKFGRRFASGLKRLKKNPQLFYDKLHQHTPQVIFLLLPVFALLLKVLYVRSGTYYIQHIIFSFYFHAYIFFILFLSSLLESTRWTGASDLALLLDLAIPLSLYFGMKRVYGQSRGKTFLKFSLLSFAYGCVLIAAVAVTVFVVVSYL